MRIFHSLFLRVRTLLSFDFFFAQLTRIKYNIAIINDGSNARNIPSAINFLAIFTEFIFDATIINKFLTREWELN